MTQCSTVDAQLDAYLRGSLPEAEATALERHAAECARCGPLVEERSRLDLLLPKEVAPPPHQRERVLARVAAHGRSHRARWWIPAAMAAGLLLAIGLMRPPAKHGQRPATPGLPAAMAAERADGEFQRLDARLHRQLVDGLLGHEGEGQVQR